MPELTIKYEDPKVKKALMDFSKYLDFSIVSDTTKKTPKSKKQGKNNLLEQIEIALKDVKKIKDKSVKGITVKQLLNEK